MIDVMRGKLVNIVKNKTADIVVHFCNCEHKLESKNSKSLAKAFPAVKEADENTAYRDSEKLGSYSETIIDGVSVISLYSQFYSGKIDYNIDYKALRAGLTAVRNKYKGKKFAIERVDYEHWDSMRKNIIKIMEKENVLIVI